MATVRGARPPIWNDLLICNEKGPLPTLANAVRVLQHDPTLGPECLWYDEFLDRILLNNSPTREWRDDDDTKLTVYMQESASVLRMPKHMVKDAVEFVTRQRVRHIVKDWLASLAWDGIPRIDEAFCDHWNAEPTIFQPHDYIRAISHNFFIGLVARVYRPGCQLDEMVVFESSRQGVGKTSALRILGGAWYAVAHERVTEKDFFQDIQGKWIIEISELSSFSAASVERIKTVISTPSDRFRGSYDRRSSDHGRQCIFAGTTNTDDWGLDATGLRRFWPVTVGEVNLVTLAAARDQLFAEALVKWTAGEHWWEVPHSAAVVQSERQHHDEWTDIVLPWAHLQLAGGDDCVAVKDILVNALKFTLDKLDKGAQMRVGRILKLASWTRNPRTKRWYPGVPPIHLADEGGTSDSSMFTV